MQSEPQPSTRTSGRFFGSAGQFGFTPPPIGLRLKLIPAHSHWTLFVQPLAPSSMGQLVGWLEAWSPLRIEFGSRDVLRADFDPLPEAWSARFRLLDLDMLRLSTNGDAVASISGPRPALAAFSRLVSLPDSHIEVRRLADEPLNARLLTPAQDQALREAVHAGYYRIPRPLNLHQLAGRLDVSCSSLSERLRRAEGRVITRYVNAGGRSPWDERTLYDAHALGAPDLEGAQDGAPVHGAT